MCDIHSRLVIKMPQMRSFTSLSICCVSLSQRLTVACSHLSLTRQSVFHISFYTLYISYTVYIYPSFFGHLSVCVLIQALETCCMEEPGFRPSPAVVPQGKSSKFPVMFFKPAALPLQRNYESWHTFCISFLDSEVLKQHLN